MKLVVMGVLVVRVLVGRVFTLVMLTMMTDASVSGSGGGCSGGDNLVMVVGGGGKVERWEPGG